MSSAKIFSPKKNLKPMKIWLSGAIPESEAWAHPLTDRDILEFVAYFSALVFQKGGTIIHGCHPLFTPILAEQARKFARSQGQLQLYVSAMWGKADFQKFEKHAVLKEVSSYQNSRKTENAEHRNLSLELLRREMVNEADCIVAIGGKLHAKTQITPGVIEEVEMAKKRRIPCYNVASYGGAASKVNVEREDNKFLSQEELNTLLNTIELNFLPSLVVKLISRDARKILFSNFIHRILRK